MAEEPMLSLDDAQRRLLDEVIPLAAERVALCDAVGRVLAEDVLAPAPQPLFHYSAMDGYAVATAQLPLEAPFELPVVGESRAGGPPLGELLPQTTMRIFTGAPLPAGADAVVMQEDVTRVGEQAQFTRRPAPWEHVRRAGEDMAAGAVALVSGTRVQPRHLALLASTERAFISVGRRPVVSIVSTGDELREVGERPRPGSIIDCNGPTIAAMVDAAGGVARRLPFAHDEQAHVEAALLAAKEGADLVVTIGGVSVGAHDVVRPALAAAGIDLEFWKVAIKPGKPLAIGRFGRGYYLGLPGNPASAMLTFMLFGVPLLRALSGDPKPRPVYERAVLARSVVRTAGRTEFLRAQLSYEAGVWKASPLGNQASGATTTFAWADALVVVPQDVAELTVGTVVDVLRL